MYRMYGMSQGAMEGGVTMYRMYGQIFAPAISALPPSMVVVCHKEPWMGMTMYRMYGMSQGARDGGMTMYRMYGMSQGARDGGVTMLNLADANKQKKSIRSGITLFIAFRSITKS